MDREQNKKNQQENYPDISGIFDIDESKIPSELIKKAENKADGKNREAVFAFPDAMRLLPKEEQEKIKKERQKRQRETKKRKRKTRFIMFLIAVITVFLLTDIVKYLIKDSKKPVVALEKPTVETIVKYYGKKGVIAKYKDTGAAVFIDNDYDVHSIKIGMPADIIIGENTVSGAVADIKEESPQTPLIKRLYSILGDSLPKTAVYAVYVAADAGLVLPEEGAAAYVKVKIKTANDALTIPSSALYESGRQHYVWIYATIKKTLRRQEVTIGISADGKTQITAGIKKSDRIVTEISCDSYEIYEGMQVKKD